jgi:hypothetical protein
VTVYDCRAAGSRQEDVLRFEGFGVGAALRLVLAVFLVAGTAFGFDGTVGRRRRSKLRLYDSSRDGQS